MNQIDFLKEELEKVVKRYGKDCALAQQLQRQIRAKQFWHEHRTKYKDDPLYRYLSGGGPASGKGR